MSKLSKNEQEQIEAIFKAREGRENWLSGEALMEEVNNIFESSLERLKEVNKRTGFQAKKMETDEQGNLLLDPSNPEDVEWWKNDAAYNIVPNEDDN